MGLPEVLHNGHGGFEARDWSDRLPWHGLTIGDLARWVERLWSSESASLQDKNRSAIGCQCMANQATGTEAQVQESTGSTFLMMTKDVEHFFRCCLAIQFSSVENTFFILALYPIFNMVI